MKYNIYEFNIHLFRHKRKLSWVDKRK